MLVEVIIGLILVIFVAVIIIKLLRNNKNSDLENLSAPSLPRIMFNNPSRSSTKKNYTRKKKASLNEEKQNRKKAVLDKEKKAASIPSTAIKTTTIKSNFPKIKEYIAEKKLADSDKKTVLNLIEQINNDNTKDKTQELIDFLNNKLISLKSEISELRKAGQDTKMADLEMINIPSKIKIFAATLQRKDFEKVINIIEYIEIEIGKKQDKDKPQPQPSAQV